MAPQKGARQMTRTAPKIILLGGSNTVMKAGWSLHLADQIGDKHEIVNLACGAASTLMGLYRFLRHADQFAPGDIVIWEYALNDQSYFMARQPAEVLLAHVKWLVRLCHERQLRFVPLILHPRPWYAKGQDKRYYAGLEAYFSAAGLTPVSDAPMVQKMLAKGASLTRLYQDEAHFRLKHQIVRRLAKQVARAVQNVKPLQQGALTQGIAAPEAKLKLIDDFHSAKVQPMANRLFQGNSYPVDSAPSADCHGTVLGVILTVDTQLRAMEIRAGNRLVGPLSTQANPEHVKNGWSLKQISLEGEMPHRPLVAAGPVRFQRAQPAGRPKVAHTFIWSAQSESGDLASIDDGIVALVVQTGIRWPLKLRLRFAMRAAFRRLVRPLWRLLRRFRR
jgi:hypothetical protein